MFSESQHQIRLGQVSTPLRHLLLFRQLRLVRQLLYWVLVVLVR
jgi:hypothetical protein